MTENKKQMCQEMLKEYRELNHKTFLFVENYVPGKPLRAQTLNIDDILRKEELRKKLLDTCKDYLEEELSVEELFELESDS